MGSGASGVELSEAELESALMEICGSLAGQLIADAEGSSKTVAITIKGAVTENEAVEVARACARNNLLKCAIFGADPNWGRVLAAVGTADAQMDALNIDVIVPFIETLFRIQFLPRDIYFISQLPSDVRFDDVMTVGVMSFILSILATIYPSRRAALVKPAEALRYE